MRTTYGILDLVALVVKLLAPFVEPLRAEWRAIAYPRPQPAPLPTTPPEPEPVVRPTTVNEIVTVVTGAALPAACVVEMTTQPSGERVRITTESPFERSATPSDGSPPNPVGDAGIPASLPDVQNGTSAPEPGIPVTAPAGGVEVRQGPLFVRKPAGKKWRYHIAGPNAPGPKFRKLVAGRRVKYEPCL